MTQQITQGALFTGLAAAGYMVLLASDGSVVIRPRADLTQNPSVLTLYSNLVQNWPDLARTIRSKSGVDYLVTHIGRTVWSDFGPVTLVSVDVVNNLATIQLQDQAQTTKVVLPRTLSPMVA